MNNHTPGKWKLHDMEDNVVVGEDHLAIADVNATKRSKGENQANTALIAAAPDLLEAIKYYLRVLDEVKERGWRDKPDHVTSKMLQAVAKTENK